MSALFGAVEIPTVNVSPDLAGDPLISRLARFLVAAIVNDNGIRDAWAQTSRGVAPIRKVFLHDPEDDHLPQPASTDLPALYLYWHETIGEKRFAADFNFRERMLHLRYVFELRDQDKQVERIGLPNAIVNIATLALYTGRTPSFRVVGDTDPSAEDLGSFMPPFVGISRVRVGKTTRKPLRLRRAKGSEQVQSMLSTITEIVVEEQLRFVADPATRYAQLAGADLTFELGDDPPVIYATETLVAQFLGLSSSSGAAAGGTSLTLSGRYLIEPVHVFFGAAEADVAIDSPVQLTLTTPAHAAGVVDVVLTNGDGSVLTLPNGFTFT